MPSVMRKQLPNRTCWEESPFKGVGGKARRIFYVLCYRVAPVLGTAFPAKLPQSRSTDMYWEHKHCSVVDAISQWLSLGIVNTIQFIFSTKKALETVFLSSFWYRYLNNSHTITKLRWVLDFLMQLCLLFYKGWAEVRKRSTSASELS